MATSSSTHTTEGIGEIVCSRDFSYRMFYIVIAHQIQTRNKIAKYVFWGVQKQFFFTSKVR